MKTEEYWQLRYQELRDSGADDQLATQIVNRERCSQSESPLLFAGIVGAFILLGILWDVLFGAPV